MIPAMPKKLTGRALARFESTRDIWKEVLDGAREIKNGGGRRVRVELEAGPTVPRNSGRPGNSAQNQGV